MEQAQMQSVVEAYCWHCRQEFTVIRRRHHCRNCAGAFCDECSSRRISLPHMGFGDKEVRACDACYSELRFSRYLASMNSVSAPGGPCMLPFHELCAVLCTTHRASTRF